MFKVLFSSALSGLPPLLYLFSSGSSSKSSRSFDSLIFARANTVSSRSSERRLSLGRSAVAQAVRTSEWPSRAAVLLPSDADTLKLRNLARTATCLLEHARLKYQFFQLYMGKTRSVRRFDIVLCCPQCALLSNVSHLGLEGGENVAWLSYRRPVGSLSFTPSSHLHPLEYASQLRHVQNRKALTLALCNLPQLSVQPRYRALSIQIRSSAILVHLYTV